MQEIDMITRCVIVSFPMDGKYLKAVILMAVSSLSFAVMSLMVSLADNLPLFEKVFFRNLISLMITIAVILKKKGSFLGLKKNRGLLIVRSLSGLMGVMLYFYSVSFMNLADSAMLNKMSPFFVILFAALILREKLYSYQIAAIITAFLASLLIIKPS